VRIKATITIDESVLRPIETATSRGRSRSRVIEDAAREFRARRSRAAREARDLEIKGVVGGRLAVLVVGDEAPTVARREDSVGLKCFRANVDFPPTKLA